VRSEPCHPANRPGGLGKFAFALASLRATLIDYRRRFPDVETHLVDGSIRSPMPGSECAGPAPAQAPVQPTNAGPVQPWGLPPLPAVSAGTAQRCPGSSVRSTPTECRVYASPGYKSIAATRPLG
jgi:hypothetical protein